MLFQYVAEDSLTWPSQNNLQNKDPFQQWLVSIYWSYATMTTVGSVFACYEDLQDVPKSYFDKNIILGWRGAQVVSLCSPWKQKRQYHICYHQFLSSLTSAFVGLQQINRHHRLSCPSLAISHVSTRPCSWTGLATLSRITTLNASSQWGLWSSASLFSGVNDNFYMLARLSRLPRRVWKGSIAELRSEQAHNFVIVLVFS